MSLPLRKATLRRLKNYLRQMDKVKTLAENAIVVEDDWGPEKESPEETSAKPERKDGTDAQTAEGGKPSSQAHFRVGTQKCSHPCHQDSQADPNDSFNDSSPDHSDDDDDTESPGTTAPSTPSGTRPSSPTSDKSEHSSSSSSDSTSSASASASDDDSKLPALKKNDDEQWVVRRSELDKLRKYHKALTSITGSLYKGISRVYAAEDEVFNRRHYAARVSGGRWPVPVEVKRQANAWAYDGRSPLYMGCTAEEWLEEEEEERRQQEAWMESTSYDYEYRWDDEDNWDDEGRRVHKI